MYFVLDLSLLFPVFLGKTSTQRCYVNQKKTQHLVMNNSVHILSVGTFRVPGGCWKPAPSSFQQGAVDTLKAITGKSTSLPVFHLLLGS